VSRRADDARKYPNVLGVCLHALARGAEDEDAQAGARVLGETVLMIRSALTKKG
jgi:hypothetical protein